MSNSNASTPRDRFLNAAQAVIVEKGAGRLTFDALAAWAGVSKGGLLYQFPSKQAILVAMIDRMCERFDPSRTAAQSRDRGPDPALKADIGIALGGEPGQHRVAASLLAAVANNMELLKPMSEHYRHWLQQLAPQRNFPRVAALWLAAEGPWLLQLLKCLSAYKKTAAVNSRLSGQTGRRPLEGGRGV